MSWSQYNKIDIL